MADDFQDPTAIGKTASDNKIRIDKGYFYAHTRHISGRELLELAEKKSPEDFAIYTEGQRRSTPTHRPRREGRP